VVARFVIAWLIIIAVASYDTFLTAKNSAVILDVELNPLGKYLMESPGGVALFIGLKTAGLGLALLLATALWEKESFRRKLLGCCYAVAAFKLALLAFLWTDVEWMRTRRPPPRTIYAIDRGKRPGSDAIVTTPQTAAKAKPIASGGDKDDRLSNQKPATPVYSHGAQWERAKPRQSTTTSWTAIENGGAAVQ
jgi:hypothetical protein